MYDKNSDYALNKRSRDSIVCRSVTGEHIHIRREDFSSDEEFERWKAWSDKDYHETEKLNRKHDDCKLSLKDEIDSQVPSAENVVFDEEGAYAAQLTTEIEDRLTEKQFRRLHLYYLEHRSECEIAKLEGVGQQRVSKSILTGKRALEKFLRENSKNRG